MADTRRRQLGRKTLAPSTKKREASFPPRPIILIELSLAMLLKKNDAKG